MSSSPSRGSAISLASFVIKRLDQVTEVIGRAVSWLTLVMILIGAWNALARYAGRWLGLELSSNGVIETQWYMFALVFLLCAPYTLKHDKHVRVDVFYGRLGPRGQAWINLLGAVLLLAPFSAFAIIYTWPGAVESWRLGEVSPDPGGLARYPLKAVVPVAFGLLLLQGIAEGLRAALIIKGLQQAGGLRHVDGPTATGVGEPREGEPKHGSGGESK